jgi:hypothetical protein
MILKSDNVCPQLTTVAYSVGVAVGSGWHSLQLEVQYCSAVGVSLVGQRARLFLSILLAPAHSTGGS